MAPATIFTLILCVVSVGASDSCKGSSCDDGEDSALLQVHRGAPAQLVKDVPCTYDEETYCAGNQCCPRADATGNKTYPCPTADANWNGCEGSAPEAVPYSAVQEREHVACTYDDDTWCYGNQCCPGVQATGFLPYPCPTADEGFEGCPGTEPKAVPVSALQKGKDVPCTYDEETYCAGNQCCPRAEATGNKTYPCPSADANWNGCEGSAPEAVPYSALQNGKDVPCTYDAETYCAGNQCCPRAEATGNNTYPCPTADAHWNGCEGSAPEAVPYSAVQEREHVACTYDDNTWCYGNQCCPGVQATGFLPYPCPTADEGFEGCPGTEPKAVPVSALQKGKDVPCTYDEETYCAGNQCCPRAEATGNTTYPCPTADEGWNGCEGSAPEAVPYVAVR